MLSGINKNKHHLKSGSLLSKYSLQDGHFTAIFLGLYHTPFSGNNSFLMNNLGILDLQLGQTHLNKKRLRGI